MCFQSDVDHDHHFTIQNLTPLAIINLNICNYRFPFELQQQSHFLLIFLYQNICSPINSVRFCSPARLVCRPMGPAAPAPRGRWAAPLHPPEAGGGPPPGEVAPARGNGVWGSGTAARRSDLVGEKVILPGFGGMILSQDWSHRGNIKFPQMERLYPPPK